MTDIDLTILAKKATAPEHVLFQEVAGNAALLNLDSETYFGLDDVGTRMWQAMEQAETIGAAARALADEYDAPLVEIERDMAKLAADLRSHGLLDIGA